MNLRRIALLLIVPLVLTLTACGAQSVKLADVPVFTGATELKAGESPIGDTLAKNMQQSQAAGSSIEQKGFQLPKDATWEQVKGFYTDKLKASGWSDNSLVSGMLAQASQGNDTFQIANWQRTKQNISVIMIISPTDPNDKQLIISLASQP